MAGFSGHWVFAFGLLGNIISFMVYLAPIPTFYQIYKKKSSEGFQAIPYVVALFSAALWIYYALLKCNATLIITINSVGCIIETIYILFFIFYATKKLRVQTVKLLVLLIVCGMGFIGVTHFLVKASQRAIIVGWICLIFSLCVFIAPLCIVIPNVLGFSFGVLQMVLYVMYKNAKNTPDQQKLPETQKQTSILKEQKNPEVIEQIIEIVKLSALLNSDQKPAKVLSNDKGVQVPNLPKECEV
ncbi:Multitransmembrane protein [Handroanthus impetiginosus]|uniref:Bidirectional sugar transporter SWEET n=1 Tax=Handroanthus impetiginosus TaxID=429701 RepID=A0A2G9G2D4_9LAMI|nr:Multitransmembrane protein [Handroanthus impetiginosus]